jgi:hypothetical protein
MKPMNRWCPGPTTWVLALALAIVIAAPEAAHAAEREQQKANRTAWSLPDGTLLATMVIGARVKNREGKDLGKIEHLVIDPKSGSVSHVIVGLGGLAGVGETQIALPWNAIVMGSDPSLPHRAIASVEQGTVDSAPRWSDPERRPWRERPPSASPGSRLEPAPSAPGPGPRN